MKNIKYKNWTIIDWDGNPDLNLKCWRKSFGHGHVSIGIGEFLTICYSYGPDASDSMSSTRWRKDKNPLTEEEAKTMVDENNGLYNFKDPREA